jgi:hypothetical protein
MPDAKATQVAAVIITPRIPPCHMPMICRSLPVSDRNPPVDSVVSTPPWETIEAEWPGLPSSP